MSIALLVRDSLLSNCKSCTIDCKHILFYNFLKLHLAYVFFALKSWKDYLLLFTYLITLGKDVTLPLITKFKANRPLSNLFVNRIPN